MIVPQKVKSSDVIGCHLYAYRNNDDGDTCQYRYGTGWLSFHDLGKIDVYRQGFSGEQEGATDYFALHTRAMELDQDFEIVKDGKPKFIHRLRVLVESMQLNPHAETKRVRTINEKYQDGDRHTCTDFRRNMACSNIANISVPIWAFESPSRDTATHESVYLNAFFYALMMHGQTKEQFFADPHAQVLAYTVGWFANVCFYLNDSLDDCKTFIDQFAIIRDHPDPEARSGDCEDMAREIQMSFDWIVSYKGANAYLALLQKMARAFDCYTIDAAVQPDEKGTVLHHYCRLISKDQNIAVEGTRWFKFDEDYADDMYNAYESDVGALCAGWTAPFPMCHLRKEFYVADLMAYSHRKLSSTTDLVSSWCVSEGDTTTYGVSPKDTHWTLEPALRVPRAQELVALLDNYNAHLCPLTLKSVRITKVPTVLCTTKHAVLFSRRKTLPKPLSSRKVKAVYFNFAKNDWCAHLTEECRLEWMVVPGMFLYTLHVLITK